MKVKQALIQRAVKNGAIEKTNRLLSAAHILNCEANGLIEEANDILRENGLLVGELKKVSHGLREMCRPLFHRVLYDGGGRKEDGHVYGHGGV